MVAESENRPKRGRTWKPGMEGKPGPKPKPGSIQFRMRLSPAAAEWLEAQSIRSGRTQSELLWDGMRLLAESGQLGAGVKAPVRV